MTSARTNQQQCAIIVPVYCPPTHTETLSLRCLEKVLSGYPRFLLKPASLELEIEGFIDSPMEDSWFLSKKTYGLLMASSSLYERFSDFEYVLIYQLDCLVFKNELSYWCSRGYDLCSSACFNGSFSWQNQDFVSNGGLSLRKVDSCLKILRRIESDKHAFEEHRKWILADGAEDIWWGLVAPSLDPSFKIIPLEESLEFSFHFDPLPYLRRSPAMPPFACHAWLAIRWLPIYYKYLPFSFWEKVTLSWRSVAILLLRAAVNRLERVICRIKNLARPNK